MRSGAECGRRSVPATRPGKVRELMHVLERGAVMSSAEILDERDSGPADTPILRIIGDEDLDMRRNVQTAERALIERALARSNGNRARLLGTARPQLYSKMRNLGMKS
jgi:DNA-binding NtrC family response regulator